MFLLWNVVSFFPCSFPAPCCLPQSMNPLSTQDCGRSVSCDKYMKLIRWSVVNILTECKKYHAYFCTYWMLDLNLVLKCLQTAVVPLRTGKFAYSCYSRSIKSIYGQQNFKVASHSFLSVWWWTFTKLCFAYQVCQPFLLWIGSVTKKSVYVYSFTLWCFQVPIKGW